MMQILDAGGVEVVTDNLRTADSDNPRGYYEFEKVKQVKRDASWLPGIRGKAVKMVSQLLLDLPPTERYRVVFMERDFAEMLDSQERMLRRLGREAAPRETRSSPPSPGIWMSTSGSSASLTLRSCASATSPWSSVPSRRSFAWTSSLRRPTWMSPGRSGAVDPSLYRNCTAVSGTVRARRVGREALRQWTSLSSSPVSALLRRLIENTTAPRYGGSATGSTLSFLDLLRLASSGLTADQNLQRVGRSHPTRATPLTYGPINPHGPGLRPRG